MHWLIQLSSACIADHLLPFEKQFAAGMQTSLTEACAGLQEWDTGWCDRRHSRSLLASYLAAKLLHLRLQKNRLLAIFRA